MSDRNGELQLRESVERRLGPLHEIEPPDNPAELTRLAGDDPELLNALWESGRIGPEALGVDCEEVGGDDE